MPIGALSPERLGDGRRQADDPSAPRGDLPDFAVLSVPPVILVLDPEEIECASAPRPQAIDDLVLDHFGSHLVVDACDEDAVHRPQDVVLAKDVVIKFLAVEGEHHERGLELATPEVFERRMEIDGAARYSKANS